MSAAADIQRSLEACFDTKRQIFGGDVCDLIGPSFTEGGAAGDSVAMVPLATDVECFIKELAPAEQQTVIGGESYTSTHRIEMKRSPVADAISPEYRISVHARDGKGVRIFEKPIAPEESLTPLTVLKASLVRQGYQS